MSNPNIVRCTNCARQIVSYVASDKDKVGGRPAIHGVGNSYICHECAKDLDENGLYPEERNLSMQKEFEKNYGQS